MNSIYSTGEVAKLLKIARHQLEYALANNQVPDASLRFLGKRCFIDEDIPEIAEYFGVEIERGGQRCSSSST